MSASFDDVAAYVRSGAWTAPLTNDEKLVLYSLFKQATQGDAPESGPFSLFDPVGAAKFDAWRLLRGLPRDAARAAYVDEFNTLHARYGTRSRL